MFVGVGSAPWRILVLINWTTEGRILLTGSVLPIITWETSLTRKARESAAAISFRKPTAKMKHTLKTHVKECKQTSKIRTWTRRPFLKTRKKPQPSLIYTIDTTVINNFPISGELDASSVQVRNQQDKQATVVINHSIQHRVIFCPTNSMCRFATSFCKSCDV